MKLALGLVTVLFSLNAFAHDGGHGPQLSDTGKYGGLVSPVVRRADAPKGEEAELIFKAEMSRADGVVRLYIYDKNMKPLDTKTLSPKATASLGAKAKGQWRSVDFPLELKGKAFEGKMPKPHGRPYNIDVTFKDGDLELLSAFDNLD